MVIIVTGAIGIGKTTVCERVIKAAQSQGYTCGGIISYKAPDNSIIVEDVQSGKRQVLASISNIYQGHRTGKYFFNPVAIDFGIQAIDRGIASAILVVDEIGHLELRGEGFVKVIELIKAGKVKSCIMVIRKALLPAFLSQIDVKPLVFETTLANRNQLPREIGLILTQAVRVKDNKN